MHPILWIGLPALLVGSMQTKQALADDDLSPKIAGVDARFVIGGAGVLASLLLGGPFAMLGLGTAIGSAISLNNTEQVKKGLNKSIVAGLIADATKAQKEAGVTDPQQLLDALMNVEPDDEDEDGVFSDDDDDDDNDFFSFLRKGGKK